jgi:hypothetical protein
MLTFRDIVQTEYVETTILVGSTIKELIGMMAGRNFVASSATERLDYSMILRATSLS